MSSTQKYIEVSEQTPHKKGDQFRLTVWVRAPFNDITKRLIETWFRILAYTMPKAKLLKFEWGVPNISPEVATQSPPYPLTIYYECIEDF